MNHEEDSTQDSIQQIIKQKRETFRVQIRKEQVDNEFRMKRQNILSSSKRAKAQYGMDDPYPTKADIPLIETYMQKWYNTITDCLSTKQYCDIIQTMQVIMDYVHTSDGFLKVKPDYNICQLKLFCFKKFNILDLFNNLFEICQASDSDQLQILDLILRCLQNFFCLDVFDDREQLNNKEFMNKLITLLEIPSLQSSIFYLLSNLIAYTTKGDETKKQILIEHNITTKLHELWSQRKLNEAEDCLVDLSWFLSNFIGHQPDMHIIQVQKVLPLAFACCFINNNEIQHNSLQVISNAAQQRNDLITYIVQHEELIKAILKLATSSKNQQKAVSALANLSAGKDRDTKILLSLGLLDTLESVFVEHIQNQKMKSMIVWIISNSCAILDLDCLQQIIKHQLIKRILMELQQLDSVGRKELAHMIKNLSLIDDLQILKQILLIDGIIEAIIYFLNMEYQLEELIVISFECIHNFARKFQRVQIKCGANQAIEFFNARGLKNILDKFQGSQNDTIQRQAIKIFELYYL